MNLDYIMMNIDIYSQSSTPSKLHTSPTTTPLAPNFWMDKIQNCLHVLQRNHRFHSLLSFWAATPLQSFPLSPLFVRHACSKSNISTANPMAFALSHTLAPTSGTISPKTSGYSLFLQKSTQDISLLRIFQLNHIVLHSHQSEQCVCMCVHFLHNYAWTLVDIYIFIFWIIFSISMYIMCVCLFSALSRRVGALQISIIIIIRRHSYDKAHNNRYLNLLR